MIHMGDFYGDDNGDTNVDDQIDFKQGRRVFYHRVVVEYGEKAAKDVSPELSP